MGEWQQGEVGCETSSDGGAGSRGEVVGVEHTVKDAEEADVADSSECGGKEEGEREVLLGKLPRTKIIKHKEEKELQYGYDLRAVQRKSGIKRVVMLGAEGRRCPAMPHRISQEAFQQRVSIDGGGGYVIALT